MSQPLMPFLRPYLFAASRPAITNKQVNAYKAVQRRCESTDTGVPSHEAVLGKTGNNDRLKRLPKRAVKANAHKAVQTRCENTDTSDPSHQAVFANTANNDRLSRLHNRKAGGGDHFYPRIGILTHQRLTPSFFHARFKNEETHAGAPATEVYGRIASIRDAGSKFYFLDLERKDCRLQALVNHRVVSGEVEDFKGVRRALRRGDWVSVNGRPTLSSAGELSIEADKSPVMLSPSLKDIPTVLESKETMSTYPHMKTLVHRRSRDILLLRHRMKGVLVKYFVSGGFVEVTTPILERAAGGAIARPFETRSNFISDTTLHLRIAPELSLKRLIIGGEEKVFEIGPVFRNEGVDLTHNPEFTMCEFYEVGASLEKLMQRTTKLLETVQKVVSDIKADAEVPPAWPELDLKGPWQELNFCETIERHIGQSLPNLQEDGARDRMSDILENCGITHEQSATLPQMLELLAEKYIEPLCDRPTWITYHPECLSPLAKSFKDEKSGQRVAARAELFIHGNEIVNCYEEENSPFEQRRKFEDQIRLRAIAGASAPDGPPPTVDEGYLEALEWGMPPTGGWGCGFDRLVMLFSGQKRIADVLPLGTLKNVVARAQLLNHGTVAAESGRK